MSNRERIVTGQKYRILSDFSNKIWDRISFWTKASDVEMDDGSNVESRISSQTSSISTLSGKVSNLESTVSGQSTALNSLSSTVSSHTSSINSLSGSVSSLSSDNTINKQNISANSSNISSLQSTVNGQTSTINNHSSILNNLNREIGIGANYNSSLFSDGDFYGDIVGKIALLNFWGVLKTSINPGQTVVIATLTNIKSRGIYHGIALNNTVGTGYDCFFLTDTRELKLTNIGSDTLAAGTHISGHITFKGELI